MRLLLFQLGLGATETTRQKVIQNYKQQMIQNSLQAYVRLLSQQRWKGIDHSIIKHHVPYLDGFTFDELMVAVERHKVCFNSMIIMAFIWKVQ